MRELRFRDLTQPITGVVEMRSQNDLIVDLQQGVTLSPTNPRGSLRSDISLERNASALSMIFNPSRRSTLTFRSAADINATFTSTPDTSFGGAILIDGARTVNFTNSGRLSVSATSSGLDILEILRADQVTIANSGALSFTGGTGVSASGFTVTARDISITNSGAIDLTRGSAFNLTVDDYVNARTPGRIVINNTADIRTQDASFEAGTRLPPRSRLRMLGIGGTISVTNSGAWTNAPMFIETANERPTDTIAVTVENEGALIRSSINAVIDNFQYRTVDNIDINPRLYEQGTFSLINRGTLTDSQLFLSAEARNTSVTLINSGNSVDGSPLGLRGATLFATASGAMSGATSLQITNSGNLVLSGQPGEFVNSGTFIYGESSHSLDLLNTGTLSTQGTPNAIGIAIRQGAHIWSPGPADDREEYVFDVGATVVNRGAISLGNVSGSSSGIVVHRAYGDLGVTNSAAISVAANGAANLAGAGLSLQGYSDTVLANSGAISVAGSGAGAAAGIFFAEVSFSNGVVTSQAGRLRGYDRAADLASRVSISTTANVDAAGAGDFGILGIIGVVDDVTDRRYADAALHAQFGEYTASNDRASALIEIGSGATVSGGTGNGSGIGIQGVGSVTVTNAGTILGRGNAGTGAIVLGDLLATNPFGDDLPVRNPALFLNLVDSVNSGTIRSDLGYGIWAQNGSITNLVNRGLILGGEGSVRAARVSTVSNEEAGILDGRITLAGAGSRLTNAGIIRSSGPASVTHEINGDFIQTRTGTLILGAGAGGRDRMNVTGNFQLDGNLNLALGAPSPEAIITVGGNLTLDGRLNVSDAGGFGSGVYRLFNYGGTLTDNGLELSALPGGARGNIQTVFANQVNLVVGSSLQFWDGGDTAADLNVDGGSGTWSNTATNWTRAAGDVNEAWGGNFAVFQGAAGTVTIVAEGVSASGLQFAVNGYRIEGGALTLAAPATLRVGDGTAAGAGFTGTIASTIAGAGGLVKTDLGTLILTGSNTYTGGTTVAGGVLQVAGDSNLGAASGGVTLDGGTLRFSAAATTGRAFTIAAGGGTLDAVNALTLTGAIAGSGALTKTGGGALTLSGNSSAYLGTFTLGAGSLRLDGSLGGTLVANAGTRVGGAGTLNNLVVAGTLAPGNGLGTLTATGNATFGTGSVFEVEVDPSGSSDRLVVAGTATLQGGTVSALFLGNQSGSCGTAISSTILTAQGGVTGTFGGVTTNFAFLTPSLSYDANNVRLTLSRNAATFTERGATANQRQSGAAAEALRCGNAVFDAIVRLDAPGARNAFDQISGEVHASAQGALIDESRFIRDAMLAPRARRGLWAEGYGSWGNIGGDGNAAVVDRDSTGAFFGIDVPIGRSWSAGLAAGHSRSDYRVGGRLSNAEVESWHVAGRLEARFGGLGVAAGGAMAWHSFDVARAIVFDGFADSAAAQYDGETRQLFVRAGYELALGRVSLEPYADLAWVQVETGAFRETGGAAALSGGARSGETWISTLGARATAPLGRLSLSGRLGWRHIFEAQAHQSILAFAGGGDFTVAGVPISEDAIVAELGGELELGGGARLEASYRGQIGNDTQDHGVRATMSWKF